MTAYRHAKIAELLSIFWACNDADAENAPNWTKPNMSDTVCNPLSKAIRALLEADFYIYDNASELVEQTMTMLMDGFAHFDYQVTGAVEFVLSDNDCA